MSLIHYVLPLSAMTFCFYGACAEEPELPKNVEEVAEVSSETLKLSNPDHLSKSDLICEKVDESGWTLLSTGHFSIHFPGVPKVERRAGITTYSSLDSGVFPVVMYTLTVNKSKSAFEEAEVEVRSYLEKVSAYPSNLLHHEIAESEDEIVVDTLTSDAKTRVFRCERVIFVKNAIYTLTTLFFPNSAENHEYFVEHFVRTF